MIIKKNIIVIVDGYSSGVLYAPAFIGHGYHCVHVNTNPGRISLIYSECNDAFYIESLSIYYNDISPVLNKLQRYTVKAVIAGSEVGVNTTDLIADHFQVEKNSIASTKNRRNKFFMIEALKQYKVSYMKQVLASDLDSILNWYAESGLSKVVLKPTMSAGSDGVAMCSNSTEIEKAYKQHYLQRNTTGEINTEFVLQECLEGNEYMVNSVSCRGEHFITDMWIGMGGLENCISTDKYADLIQRESKDFKQIELYVFKALDALGIKNGAAHSEVKLTTNGPMLIECGARLTGGLDFSVLEESQGYSQLSLSVESVLYPDQFKNKIANYAKLSQKHVRFIYLCSYVEGVILRDPNLEDFLEILSLESISFIHKKDDYLYRTDEVVGRPGFAFLVADTPAEIEHDYIKFIDLEMKMYQYILDPNITTN